MADQNPPRLARDTSRAPASWPMAMRGSGGEPGVAFAITGPGLTNAATALGQAYGRFDPLAADLVRSTAGMNWASARATCTRCQARRTCPPASPHSRTRCCGRTSCRTLLAAAYAVFRSARPRPVHIEIPIDVGEEKSEWADDPLHSIHVVAWPAPAPAALDEAVAADLRRRSVLLIHRRWWCRRCRRRRWHRPRRVDLCAPVDDDH